MSKKDGTIKVGLYLSITKKQLANILLGHKIELVCTGYAATGTIGKSSKKDRTSWADNSRCGIFWLHSAEINYREYKATVICVINNERWGMSDDKATLIITCDNWCSVVEHGDEPRYSAEAVLHTYVNKSFVEVFKRCNITLDVETID